MRGRNSGGRVHSPSMGTETWTIDSFVGDTVSIKLLVLVKLCPIWSTDGDAVYQTISRDVRATSGGKRRVVVIWTLRRAGQRCMLLGR